MIKVLVLSDIDNLYIQRQRYQNIEFVFDTNEEYDFLAILDDVGKSFNCKVPKRRRILYLGEPPYIKPYSSSYLKQFGVVVGCHKLSCNNYIKNRTVLPFRVGLEKGFGYDYFNNLVFSKENRINKFCIVTSNKKFTDGHRKRVEFVEKIKQEYPDMLDIFGNGYEHISDKYDVLSKYKYCLAIENCVYENYWTEKISDSYLSGCYPFYYGCPNIFNYFPKSSLEIIDINDYQSTVLKMKEALYSKNPKYKLEHLLHARNLVLNDYNVFSVIANDVLNLLKKEKEEKYKYNGFEYQMLSPYQYTLWTKVRQKLAWKFNIIIP